VVADCPKCGERISAEIPEGGRYRPRCPHCFAELSEVEADLVGVAKVSSVAEDTVVVRSPQNARGIVPLTPAPIRSRVANSSLVAVSCPEVRPATQPGWPTIPGYAIEAVLGTGGMGTVYKARQLSLDRPVALKVMSSKWAADPLFVARFTREAFAAAQLNHPNIVQIFDIGSAGELVRFFSMEFVAGKTLSEEVKKIGRLAPEVAAGYALQAARGLLHAHDRGMIHRDVKPDNLLLDLQGIIKVADLGLVKTPDLSAASDTLDVTDSGLYALPPDMTGTRIALGTPAYMPPEQCRDAATVDHRADVYSLGATLYALVTGRPPFDGVSAVGLMKKQAYEMPVPPDQVIPQVPRELSAIILTMMAKDPSERYQTMAGVIAALEGWLGVRRAGSVAPREAFATELESCARQYRSVPAAALRNRAVGAFGTACIFAATGLAAFGKLGWAFGIAGLLIQTSLAYFILAGFGRKNYLFSRVRQHLTGLSWGDRIAIGIGLVLFALLLHGLGLLDQWIGFGMIGVALAGVLRYGLDRAMENARRPIVFATQGLLRRMRLDGVAEDDLRLFVARTAGKRWEEFFETLFGFEAKLAARSERSRARQAPVGIKYAAWREPILAFIDRAEQARKEMRERAVLADVERDRLVASGMTAITAEARAKQSASAMVKRASRLRLYDRPAGTSSSMFQQLVGAAEHPDSVYNDEDPPDPVGRLFAFFVGPAVRGLLAVALLTLCGMWIVQNNGFQAEVADWVKGTAGGNGATTAASHTEVRFTIPGVDARYAERVDGRNVGVAGLLLLISLFHRGTRMGVFVLLGAAIAAVGPAIGPTAFQLLREAHLAILLGTSLALMGFRLGAK
jgi:serine/threonine protein kinase